MVWNRARLIVAGADVWLGGISAAGKLTLLGLARDPVAAAPSEKQWVKIV
jgi:hypothetical protein